MSSCDYFENAIGLVVLADSVSTFASPASSEIFPVVVSVRVKLRKSIGFIVWVALEIH